LILKWDTQLLIRRLIVQEVSLTKPSLTQRILCKWWNKFPLLASSVKEGIGESLLLKLLENREKMMMMMQC